MCAVDGIAVALACHEAGQEEPDVRLLGLVRPSASGGWLPTRARTHVGHRVRCVAARGVLGGCVGLGQVRPTPLGP